MEHGPTNGLIGGGYIGGADDALGLSIDVSVTAAPIERGSAPPAASLSGLEL